MQVKDSTYLKRAKAKIADPEHWIKGYLAIAANGNIIGPEEPNAYAWCAVGACRAVKAPCWLYDYLSSVAVYLFEVHSLPALNDWQGFDAVHIVYDEAIKLKLKEERAKKAV